MSSSKGPPPRADTEVDNAPPPYTDVADNQHSSRSANVNTNSISQQQADGPGDAPPPAYADVYGELDLSENGMETTARVTDDGRININVNESNRYITGWLTPALEKRYTAIPEQRPQLPIPEFAKNVPPLNVLIQIIGSRGDVQPFLALGKELQRLYGHRVRIATHPTFNDFVTENGLEFFSLGGDPSELMAFMVKNPGLMPGMDSLKSGDVTKRRQGMWEILLGGWRACIEPGDGMSYTAAAGADSGSKPFIADAIIANPPSFGHIHCAEKLGIPLHLMFTMPWSPTAAFPHPLANIQNSNTDSDVTNFLSYALVEMMTWQGLGDLVNKFREKTLGLDAIATMWATGMMSRLKVPHTYCWSPALIPKPADWSEEIDISGFFFLPLASSYTPPPELERFLSSGPPPVYIGFGSIVVDDPNQLTKMVMEAVQIAGVRALVSKGWGGIGGDDLQVPENIMLLGNCPHDWLFPRCSGVVHHGGAGTTAAGISCGKPTVIVPFFGDQPFWGQMVAKAGAGPDPIPHQELTAEKLAEAIKMAVSPGTVSQAATLGNKIRHETGAETGAKSFQKALVEVRMGRCDIMRERLAVWTVKGTNIKLSALAAAVLLDEGLLDKDTSGMRLYRHKDWNTDEGAWEPITGAAGALVGTITSILMGVGDMPREVFKARKGKGKETAEGQVQGDPAASASTASLASSSSLAPEQGGDQFSPPLSPALSHASSDKPTRPKPPAHNSSGNITMATATGTAKGIRRIVGAGMKSPMDVTMGLAQGFRNAPRLYGDTQIRPTEKVTGFQSGVRIAAKEFGFGFYDGITGLATQPYEGAKKEGAVGVAKGFARGVGGLVLKSGAGFWSLPGYVMKGVHKEVLKLSTKDAMGFISAARITQGGHELQGMPREQRDQIIREYLQLRDKKGRSEGRMIWTGKLRSHSKTAADSHSDWPAPPVQPRGEKEHLGSYNDVKDFSDSDFERAIQESVAQTSQGNEDDDKEIERAIRASIREMRKPLPEKSGLHEEHDENEALERAIKASIQERTGGQDEPELAEALRQSLKMQPRYTDADSSEDEDLRSAIVASQRSGGASAMAAYQHPGRGYAELQGDEPEEPGWAAGPSRTGTFQFGEVDSEIEDLRAAIERSRRSHSGSRSTSRGSWERISDVVSGGGEGGGGEGGGGEKADEEDEEIKTAIKQSRLDAEALEAQRAREEEVVMGYVLRQSREEEELRKRRDKERKEGLAGAVEGALGGKKG